MKRLVTLFSVLIMSIFITSTIFTFRIGGVNPKRRACYAGCKEVRKKCYKKAGSNRIKRAACKAAYKDCRKKCRKKYR